MLVCLLDLDLNGLIDKSNLRTDRIINAYCAVVHFFDFLTLKNSLIKSLLTYTINKCLKEVFRKNFTQPNSHKNIEVA